MLAHELRNPLAPILTSTEILRLRGPEEPLLQRHRETIQRNARHLSRLVEDLLEVSRINEGKIELRRERVDLVGVVEHTVGTVRPLAEEYDQHLEVCLPAEPVYLDADPTRLLQIFVNLLNNAVKYTDPGGRIAVSLQLESSNVGRFEGSEPWRAGSEPSTARNLQTDVEAVIRVRDSGRGIEPELLPRIFDLFVQGERTLARKEGGLGVGLTLVRRLVELHGGTVQARSEGPGRGAEFVVRLPTG
jgi:signal transduction histidine kinase